MTTALQLQQIIGQLNEEELAKLEEYAELLLLRKQQTKQKKPLVGKNGSTAQSKAPEKEMPERWKIAQQFKGDALFPDMPSNKYDVYEQ